MQSWMDWNFIEEPKKLWIELVYHEDIINYNYEFLIRKTHTFVTEVLEASSVIIKGESSGWNRNEIYLLAIYKYYKSR